MRHLIASLVLVSVPLASSVDTGPPVTPNHLRHEPSMALEYRNDFGVSEFLVFNDGSWSWGSVTHDGNSFRIGQADPLAVRELLNDLAGIGVIQLLDQVGGQHVSGAWTLTLLYGETNADAHTLTWWHGESPDHMLLQGRVSAFLADELGIQLPN